PPGSVCTSILVTWPGGASSWVIGLFSSSEQPNVNPVSIKIRVYIWMFFIVRVFKDLPAGVLHQIGVVNNFCFFDRPQVVFWFKIGLPESDDLIKFQFRAVDIPSPNRLR